jgi:TPR repeat protein
VQTANSPPLPQAIPLPQEAENREAKTLLGKGEALLKTGDLVSARQFFMKAHVLGLAEGAYGAGRTYDPAVYTAMNVRGLEPDVAKAREWYDKAASEGYEDAIQALEKLDAAAP